MTYLDQKEVLRRLGVSRPTLHRWCKEGYFPSPVKIGPKLIRWPEDQVIAWEQSRERVVYGEG